MSQPSFNPHGAVDLSSLVRPAGPPAGTPDGGASAGSVVVEVA